MKRVILCLFLCIILVLNLIGCTFPEATETPEAETTPHIPQLATPPDIDTGKYAVLQVGVSKVGDSAEYDYYDYTVREMEATRKITVDGTEYEGVYMGAVRMPGLYLNTYSYWLYDKDGKDVKKRVRVDHNGNLLYYTNDSLFDHIPDRIISEEEAVDVARRFVNAIHDVSEYSVKVEYNSEDNEYRISFLQSLEGIFVADNAIIRMTSDGLVKSYTGYYLGLFPDSFDIQSLDIDEIKDSTMKRAAYDAAVLQNASNTIASTGAPRISLEVLSLMPLKDNKVGVELTANVEFVQEDADGNATVLQTEVLEYIVIV